MVLHVVDVSRYQAGKPTNTIPNLDGVIIGVTYGCEGANPIWKEQLNEALDDPRDLVIGLYHIRNNTVHSPAEEAQFFLDEINTHPRLHERGINTFMDSEEHPVGTDKVEWVYQWNEYIGAKRAYPLTYVGESEVQAYNWDKVATKSSLWGSQYDYTTAEQGWDDNRKLLGSFSYPIAWENGQVSEWKAWPVVAGHQYSSTTFFGSEGPFDVSLFFEDKATWYKYAGATPPVNHPAPAPAPHPAPAPAPKPAPAPSHPTQCIVERGDTLSSIATQFHTSVQAILAVNRWITNPNFIKVGWVLNLPSAQGAPTGTVYIVQSGDTLGGIAAKYGTDYQTLARYNGIPDPNKIFAGERIRIP